MKATVHTKKALLALLVPALMMQQSLAQTTEDQEPTVALEALEGTISSQPQEQVGEQILTRRTLDEQMVQNSHDLVRYNTEVDVAEIGRYGNKGFAIRGVDGNRINMNIDGVALPESEANEIFSPYGYMYEGRFNPDVEIMNSVRIHAGADSLISGSGAVGGSVTYNTKRPTDLIKGDKNWGGYAKVGYTQKNEEWLTAAGLALANNKVEAIINYAHRDGRETKNHDMRRSDKARLDPTYLFPSEEMPHRAPNGDTASSIYPDALKYEQDSVLGKFYYHVNDSHRIGVHGMYQKRENLINIDSKNITNGSRTGGGVRRAHDTEKIESYGASYRYMPQGSTWLDNTELSYTHNEVLGLADTWIYDRKLNDNDTAVLSSVLSTREYRPIKTTTDQTNLSIKTMPLNLGKFGEHSFGLHSSYIKQDYKNDARRFNYNTTTGEISVDNSAFSFSDAKKNNYNLSLIDDIYINDNLQATFGVRYDDYKYSPYFNQDEAHLNAQNCLGLISYDKDWRSKGVFCNNYRAIAGLTNVDRDKFLANPALAQQWIAENADKVIGLNKTKFNRVTWGGKINYAIIPNKLTARYNIGTGFLAPTVTQLYSNFGMNGVQQVPNNHLKPETSINQELEFDWKVQDNINLTLGGYYTKYDDFIHTRYWQGTSRDPKGCRAGNTCLQSLNLDEAKVYGLKLGVHADLSDYLNSKGKFNVFANFHTAKDSAIVETNNSGKVKINTLSAVPTSLLLGGTYNSPNDKWQLNTRINYIQRKKADDVKNIESVVKRTTIPNCTRTYYPIYNDCTEWTTSEYISSYNQVHRSKSVMLYDVYGSYKFGKNLILNAGVYNITNVKYIPWETLRQFATTSVNNMVDKEGHGFNRYTAPGRNYAVSLTYEF
ncbi:TonB-dependent hemoglobin/transferrin/lactoferrin family receptor [Moraxella sp. VT-16-12]|uniref:TonB-dependent hemoglobin/transferrin/lactoferrin family receptor n=1 Tax=Moraxella sp. VT-16-12 TaxID=2014877 RepID=UPI000B7E083D|nr:TonB-dependent hemoglobin/transferrin/lactoferrin family receptor [Moraxella sp. VT-16-12]TWV83499.1 TonB-dependent hemoglobin/transferrin/lactoferrin family receptor [Moraxella sp. VT-16-12]